MVLFIFPPHPTSIFSHGVLFSRVGLYSECLCHFKLTEVMQIVLVDVDEAYFTQTAKHTIVCVVLLFDVIPEYMYARKLFLTNSTGVARGIHDMCELVFAANNITEITNK